MVRAKLSKSKTETKPKKCTKTISMGVPVRSQPAATKKTAVKKEPKKNLCMICYKEFAYSNDLRKHLRIHSGERPFQCAHCDQKFRQAGCLKNHIACQHGTNTVYTCYYCNKSFPIKERLRLHMRIHSGERPYKCTLCPKEFARGGQVSSLVW